jgi:hypothetical protein
LVFGDSIKLGAGADKNKDFALHEIVVRRVNDVPQGLGTTLVPPADLGR